MKSPTHNENRKVADLLTALAGVRNQALELKMTLRQQPEVLSATHSIDIVKKREGGPFVQCYVEADLRNSKTVCWMLEVEYKSERFELERDIWLNDEAGAAKLRSFPVSYAETIEMLLHILEKDSAELFASSVPLDVTALDTQIGKNSDE